MWTTTGKRISVTTAFRVPAEVYQAAVALARQRRERLSATMRHLVRLGLEAETGDQGSVIQAEIGQEVAP